MRWTNRISNTGSISCIRILYYQQKKFINNPFELEYPKLTIVTNIAHNTGEAINLYSSIYYEVWSLGHSAVNVKQLLWNVKPPRPLKTIVNSRRRRKLKATRIYWRKKKWSEKSLNSWKEFTPYYIWRDETRNADTIHTGEKIPCEICFIDIE